MANITDPRYGRTHRLDEPRALEILDQYPRLKDAFRDGDEVYAYSTVECLSGTFGFLLVRDGEVVCGQIAGMS